jgi:hypothetical protein
VFGAGERPQCLEAIEPDGDGALTLLQDAPAPQEKPPARIDVEQACHSGGAPPAHSTAPDTAHTDHSRPQATRQ